jgi:hypothetical protein
MPREHLHILEIQPNSVNYAQRTLDLVAIRIDGRELWDRSAPFNASTSEIHTSICEECYCAFGGVGGGCNVTPNVLVRRHGHIVYWYLVDPFFNPIRSNSAIGLEKYPTDLAPNQIWTFSSTQYENALGGDVKVLGDFTSAESCELIGRSVLLPSALALYTEPTITGDELGREFLNSIECIVKAGGFEITDQPQSFIELTVGADSHGIPECRVQIGAVDGDCSVRFIEHPTFPLWLSSDEISRRLTRYVA